MNYKYRRTILLVTICIMGIGMATFSFTADVPTNMNPSENYIIVTTTPIANNDKSTDIPTPTIEPTNTTIPTPTITPIATPTTVPENNLLNNALPEINDLIVAYLSAKLDSTSTFEGIVMNYNMINSELLQKKTEYIKDYHNIVCYTKLGINEIDYIVYVTYDMELPIIDTFSPSLDEFYVKYSEGGIPLIYFGTIDKETENYIIEMRNSSDVKKLLKEVEDRFTEAIENDSALKEFYEKLISFSENSN